MTNKDLFQTDSHIINLILSIVGEKGFEIVKYLFNKKKADEFEISDDLKEEVNFVRSVMYKMYDYNLVNFERRRDKEKGWYIYTWELVPERLYTTILNNHQNKLNELYNRLEQEKNKEQEFICPNCSIKLDFSKSFDLNFTCFACGRRLEPFKNITLINDLNKNINSISEEINLFKEKLNKL